MKKFLTKNSKLVQVCTNCIYDEHVDGIKFDIQGKCNYCAQIESLIKEYGTGGKKGKLLLKEIFRKIKEDGSCPTLLRRTAARRLDKKRAS